MYEITPYTKRRARDLGVKIEPSKNKNKKLKVIEPNGTVFHVGDSRFMDFPKYLQISPALAEERRRLYKIRHRSDSASHVGANSGGAGYYARELLW